MKKPLVLIFVLVMVLAMTACSKVEDKVEKKVGEDTKQTQSTSEKMSEEKTSKLTETEKQTTDTSKAKEPELKGFAASLDKNLKGHELLKACEAAFENNHFARKDSVHMKMKNMASDGAGGIRENTIEMYFSADGKKERMENVTPNSEENTLTISDYENGVMYMVYGNGTGVKMPLGDEKDDVTSEMTGDDPTINPSSGEGFFDEAMGDLVTARLEDYNGETALYIEFNYKNGGLSKAWYSLDDAIALKTQVFVDDKLTYESEMIEFETGGNYDDMFNEPEGIVWQEIPNIDDIDLPDSQ